jgi:four helix bundle suffix protein
MEKRNNREEIPKRSIIAKHGGYRKLDSFTLAYLIQLGTYRFCEEFLNRRNDPCGRQFDQMTQAARSGRENIIEGSERAGTSSGTEIRLTDVARASLGELKGDYEFWLVRRRVAPWPQASAEAQAVYELRLDPNPIQPGDDLHRSSKYIMAQYDKFARWLESDDPDIVANAMLILLSRVLNMLGKQLKAQGNTFVEEGGFRERMTAVRLEERDRQQADPDAPECPECGARMVKRTARAGKTPGQPFWGCGRYPECRGTREFEG